MFSIRPASVRSRVISASLSRLSADSSSRRSRTRSMSTSARAPGEDAPRSICSSWSSSASSSIASKAPPRSRGWSPVNWRESSHPICGKASRRDSPSRDTSHWRSRSSINWSESSCSCARCSGVIELRTCCMAAMRRASTSRSSSSVVGFSGKKSPNRSMNPAKSGSWPSDLCSSIRFNSASISTMRERSSGVMACVASDTCSTNCAMSCSRSRSSRASNRWRASVEAKSCCFRPRTFPARFSCSRRSRWSRRAWLAALASSMDEVSGSRPPMSSVSGVPSAARSSSMTSRRAWSISA